VSAEKMHLYGGRWEGGTAKGGKKADEGNARGKDRLGGAFGHPCWLTQWGHRKKSKGKRLRGLLGRKNFLRGIKEKGSLRLGNCLLFVYGAQGKSVKKLNRRAKGSSGKFTQISGPGVIRTGWARGGTKVLIFEGSGVP